MFGNQKRALKRTYATTSLVGVGRCWSAETDEHSSDGDKLRGGSFRGFSVLVTKCGPTGINPSGSRKNVGNNKPRTPPPQTERGIVDRLSAGVVARRRGRRISEKL